MLLFRNIQIPVIGKLNELSLDHFSGSFDEHIQHLEVPLSERKPEGGHVEPVAHQDGDFVSPLRIHGCAPTADARVIDDVVVKQGSRVNELNHGAEPGPDRPVVPAHLRAEQKDRRPDTLAPAIADVLADVIDQRNSGAGVALDLFFHLRHAVFNQLVNLVRSQWTLSPADNPGKANQNQRRKDLIICAGAQISNST